ncbi:MAG: S8 family serine peptidase [Myxococcaceae bacterium]|nr:S8 family serine peptidase [Myxococcaceae bacterium]
MSLALPKTRWLLPCLVSLGLLAQACADAAGLEPTAGGEEPPAAEGPAGLSAAGRYIIKYRSGVGLRSAQGISALEKQGARVKLELAPQHSVAVELSPALLASLRGNPDIEYIEPDPERYPMAQQVPFGVDMVQAPLVWPQGSATERKVCIIDSGLYVAHEDIQDGSVSGYPSDWSTDGCGHGTHVAGTIAALDNGTGVVGVNPNGISLYIVKIFGNNCSATFGSSITDALNRCVANHAHVVSMSLGGQFSSTTERDAFQGAFDQGVLSIAAAGNSGNTAYSYPASYPSVISVAAVDANKQVTSFSQKNNQVDLAAPGASVLSTWPARESSSVTVSGVTYVANGVDGAARTPGVAAPLVDGGLCDAAGSWSGKMVLCERGVTTFADKVATAKSGGATGAILYNNVPGPFKGGLGTGTSTLPAVTLSQEDGQFLKANALSASATVVSQVTRPASGYEHLDGTSMATPHVSGVAALIWSVNPAWTNAQIRQALESTAEDLGTAGRDNSYGYGLVQAKAALDFLKGSGNSALTAAFTHSCSGLSCAFTDTSTASDGTITAWSWSLGDGTTNEVPNPSHTYVAAGTYTVQLTVTDDQGATATTSKAVSVSSIGIEAYAYAIDPLLHGSDVSWSGAVGSNVDVYRNEQKVATTANDDYYSDWIWFPTGTSYTYKVCQASSTICSPTITVEAQSF